MANGGEPRDWRELTLGERIVRAAWMAARDHLAQDRVESPQRDDQAAELRRWVLADRLGRHDEAEQREAA